MYGYIYRTHNKVNGKMYIGQKKSSKFLGEDYIGSGKHLWNSIYCHNYDPKKDFYVELLEEVEGNQKDLDEKESYWIDFYDAVNSDDYYNLIPGGTGGFDYINKNRLSPSCGPKENHPMYGKRGKDNPNYGKHHTKETIQKLSIASSNKKSITDGTITKKIHKDSEVPEGFRYGEHYSENKKWSEERKESFIDKVSGTITMNNGDITIRSKESDIDFYLEHGFSLGYREDQIRYGKNAPAYGMKHTQEFKNMVSENTKNRVWMNNGTKCLRIRKDEVDKYINDGWTRGRVSRKCNDHRKLDIQTSRN